MLMNNLDPDVAERPDDLVVYGGIGTAARSWPAFDAIVARAPRRSSTTRRCSCSRASPSASSARTRGRRACSSPTRCSCRPGQRGRTFRDLEDRGLTMYGQMTAGSWIYIGTQGILQGTYETLAAVARRHFGGTLRGRLTVTAGLGGMGGAQPLAVTMNDGVALVIEVDPARIERRLATRYLDETASVARRRAGAAPGDYCARGRRAVDRPRGQRRRRPAGARRARRHARRADRSDVGARRADRLRARTACRSPRPSACASARPEEYIARSMRAMADARPGDARRCRRAAR